MNLPQGTRLVRVTFEFENGVKLYLDPTNARNFQNNLSATEIMTIRGHKFLPVKWGIIKPKKK